jgi:PhnB protein
MELCPYLNFNGNCGEAFRFYEQCFGGKVMALFTYGESPMAGETADADKNRVMHACLQVNGKSLMGADGPPRQFTSMKGNCVMFGVDTPAEADRVFGELSKDGSVHMPIQETFWAQRFGICADRFGIHWMVNCGKPMEAQN